MKKIIGNIADLTDEFIKKNNSIYENYIKELIRIIVLYDGLEDYVKSIIIKKLSCYSIYNVTDGIIYCDLKRQLNSFGKETADFYNSASEREINGGKYLYIAQMLMHECDHAKQYKKSTSNELDLGTRILRSVYLSYLQPDEHISLCSFHTIGDYIQRLLFDVLNDILYNWYYEYAPEDRLADIDSYKKTLEIAKLLGLECSYKYHLSMLYDTYLDSYDQEEPPTIYYFMKTRRKELAEELGRLSDSLDFDTRLNLGLSLTKNERKKLERKREKI